MSRYFTRPKAIGWVEDETFPSDEPLVPHLSVVDHSAVDTGLVDTRGDPIMRTPNPMGFGRDGEW